MAIGPDDVAWGRAQGFAFVCCTCKKLWEGKEKGMRTCTARDGCASPMGADTFHEYDGPIGDFLSLCFVCGGKPSKAVRVKNRARLVAVCADHLHLLAELTPGAPQRQLPVLPSEVVSPGGASELVKPPPPAPRTLGRMMAEIANGTFTPDEVHKKINGGN